MRPLKNLCEIAVIGGGLAGLSAARHAARLGRLVTLFEGSGLWGGQVATVGEVEGLPLPGPLSGVDMALHLLEEARKVGVRVIEADLASVEAGKRLLLVDSEGGEHRPEAIIVATGASLRKLGVPGEAELEGLGVSRCATCDGGLYRGQDVLVIGGGDAAVHEALVLAKTARQVTMVCRSATRAKREYVDRLDARDNVRFVWDSEVVAILGSDGVTGVRLRNRKDGAETELACTGVFSFVGVVPNNRGLPSAWLTDTGQIGVTGDQRIFAAGAIRAGYGGNAIEAMAEGIQAAEAAAALLGRGG